MGRNYSLRTISFPVAVILLAALSCPARCFAERRRNSSPADWLVEIAIDHYRRGQYADALQEFAKALMIQPHHPEALAYMKILTARSSRAATQGPS